MSEQQAEYIVTFRGEPVALIQPISKTMAAGDMIGARPDAEFWEKLDKIREEIVAHWRSDRSAVELIDEQRRDL